MFKGQLTNRGTLRMSKWLLGLALTLAYFCPSTAQSFTTDGQEDICSNTAIVLFCENFESFPLDHMYNQRFVSHFQMGGWDVSGNEPTNPQGFTMDIVNTEKFDGTKSMQWTYPVNSAAGFMNGSFSHQTHIFIRYYIKNSTNWVWSHNGEKMHFLGSPEIFNNQDMSHTIMFDQGANCNHGNLAGDSTGSDPDPPCNTPSVNPQNGAARFYYTAGHYPPNGGQWVCQEEEVILGQNSNTGTINIWLDLLDGLGATQILNATGVNTGPESFFSVIAPSGYWNCTDNIGVNFPACDGSFPRNQHPVMFRWIDNIVVSTQRIGCNASSSGPGSPVITTPSLPNSTVGAPYNQTLQESGGLAPFTWSISSGSLPNGLSINSSTGNIGGTTTVAGTFVFTVRVVDSASNSGTANYSITVTGVSSPVITTTSLPNAPINLGYNQQLTETGGLSPFTWTIQSGALPTGLSLSTAGVISGIPTVAGTFNFVVLLTDSNSNTNTKALSIVVTAVFPTVTGATSTTTGLVNVTGTQDVNDPAQFIRLQYGSNTDPNIQFNNTFPIARFPGWPTNATFTFTAAEGTTWPAGTQFACIHAQDAGHNEDPNGFVCISVVLQVPSPSPPTGVTVR